MKNEQYEHLARRLCFEIEQKADEARENKDLLEKLHEQCSDAAKQLTVGIVGPLLAVQDQLVDEGIGMSLFPYAVYYFAIEYITQFLDAVTSDHQEGFPEQTKEIAKLMAVLKPIKTSIIKRI